MRDVIYRLTCINEKKLLEPIFIMWEPIAISKEIHDKRGGFVSTLIWKKEQNKGVKCERA